MSYTSLFAATGTGGAAAAAAEPEAAPSRPRGGGRLALAAGVIVALAAAAAAAGALIGHEVWTSAATPSAAPDTGTSAPVQPPALRRLVARQRRDRHRQLRRDGSINGGGFSITVGPDGVKINPQGGGGSASSSGGPANESALAAKVAPALVDVNVTSSFRGVAGAGTGVVLSSDGEVLTNNHVIDGATRVTATDSGNGRTYEAKVVGYDPSHDLAVIQLQGASGLTTATLGDSSKLSVGDKVLGLGNAGGAGGAPSRAGGTITRLARRRSPPATRSAARPSS